MEQSEIPKGDEKLSPSPREIQIEEPPENKSPLENDGVPVVPKISIQDKLFNFVSIVIPHLESIVIDKGHSQHKLNVVNKHTLDMLKELKKKLSYLEAILDPDPASFQKLVQKKSLAKIAATLGVPPESIPKDFNLVELDRVLDFIDVGLFLPAFKKWKMISSRTSLAKRMIVFCRKIDLFFISLPLALTTDKSDIFSQEPGGDVWQAIAEYTTYIVAAANPASLQRRAHQARLEQPKRLPLRRAGRPRQDHEGPA